MWVQSYRPVADSLALSALVAAIPLVVLGLCLAVWRMRSWKACLLAVATGLGIALLVYRMPVGLALTSAVFGAAFGLFPLGYLVYAAILLFDLVVESGRLDAIRRSLAGISPDFRLQALVIAFAFGGFLEGATGAGTPVAVTASILAGIGFQPLMAAALSLLANTAPVAFGALGLPVITLASVTSLPLDVLSAAIGRICPIVAVLVPAYLIVVLAGGRAAVGVWPALLVAGVTFAVFQFLVSNFSGPYLPDIVAALATIGALIGLLRVWRPKQLMLTSSQPRVSGVGTSQIGEVAPDSTQLGAAEVFRAWSPYLLLVVTVVVWGAGPTQRLLDRVTVLIPVPYLHNAVTRTAPIVPADSPYPAVFSFNWLGAAGTACLVASFLTALISGINPLRFLAIAARTARRLAFVELTSAAVLSLAYVMNYSGATATMGLAMAASGVLFPFFGAYLGWIGVFLTGSDTSTNALFGPLQAVSARNLHLNPVLMGAVNTCGGVMGKMISVQSIAVAAAATGMAAEDEGRLFRLTLKHSVLLAGVVGLIAMGYAYLFPGLIPIVD